MLDHFTNVLSLLSFGILQFQDLNFSLTRVHVSAATQMCQPISS